MPSHRSTPLSPFPAAHSRVIVVVGGVAAGASAAARARRLDERARIVVVERGAHVSFANCGLPYYVGGEITDRDRLLVAKPERFRDWFGIEVRERTEAVAIDATARTITLRDLSSGTEEVLAWDRLILAQGAAPIRPPLPGVNAPNVFTMRDLADADRLRAAAERAVAGRDDVSGRAVVVGGGYVGLEITEMLRHRGLEVTLVERLPQVLRTLDPEMALPVADALVRHGVAMRVGVGLAGFVSDDGAGERDSPVRAVRLDDGTVLAADLVVLALGVRPEVGLARAAGVALGPSGGIAVDGWMRTSVDGVYAAGDAVEYTHAVTGWAGLTPLAGPANRAGRVAGEHAAIGDGPPMEPVLGTAVVRVFDVVAGCTGLTPSAALAGGIPARAVVVRGSDHASYYPGATPLTIKLTVAEADGRLLGAQVVGGAGVDKRLDVLATAIRFGARAADLASLDLAYAPPFGSARDAVHMAGFVSENAARGLSDTIEPEELAALHADAQVVDVRTPEEHAAGMIPDALAIPLAELRARVGELDPTRPVVTVCRGGQRAYVAERLLRERGFADVRTLTGGMLHYEAWTGAVGSSLGLRDGEGEDEQMAASGAPRATRGLTHRSGEGAARCTSRRRPRPAAP
ncbi:MAG TPA: FAD-dependent oxidoreductase [Gemmatimonadales bacterium]